MRTKLEMKYQGYTLLRILGLSLIIIKLLLPCRAAFVFKLNKHVSFRFSACK